MSNEFITAIVADPHRAGRYTILADSRPVATLPIDVVERLGLRVGAPIAVVREAIDREVAALKAYDRAVNMLTARARSARDLERQLIRRGEPAEHARAAVERLRAAGYLDDGAFARQFARSKTLGAGFAGRRVRQELLRQGVDGDTADEAIAAVIDDESIDPIENAERLARKRLTALKGEDDVTIRRRLYAYLARRGYGPDVVARVVNRVVERADVADPDASV